MTDILLADGRVMTIQRRGQGRPLVMLHGWAMSSAVFSEWLEHPPEGLEMIAVDLPGHGGSDVRPEQTLDAWAESVEELVSLLNLTQPALLGWSLGGMLALKLAQRNRAAWSSLVLLSSTAKFTNDEQWHAGLPVGQLRSMQRGLRRDFRRTMEDFFKLMFAAGEISTERCRQIARFATGPALLPEIGIAAAGLDILAGEDLRPLLGQLDLPVLVIHGREDAIIPAAAGIELERRIPAAARLELQEAGHAPFLTRPEETTAAVKEFLL